MNSTKKQIETIAGVINRTKENLKPISINFIFWGIFIIVLSLFHYVFPYVIESTKYSAMLYWTILPIAGMLLTVYYNLVV